MSSRRSFYSPEVCVCEASAGSGKTYALAERYVRLILYLSRKAPSPPVYSILAITFTNKAAFEMKERIIRFLKELALGVMEEEEAARMIDGLGLTVEQVRETALCVINEILRGYNYFQVQTIDRFINTLLVSSAFQIGLTSAFKIKTDPREYLERAIDELIAESGENALIKKAFDDLLTSLLLVEARSSWMPKKVLFDTMQGLFKEYNTYARPFVRGHFTPDDILRSKVQLVDDVRLFVENMPKDIHKTVEKSLRNFVAGGRRAFLFNKDLSAYFAKDAEDIKKFNIAGWHLDQWQKIRSGFNKTAEMEIRHLYDPYIELFERVREKLTLICLKEDIIFLSELNTKARLIYEQGVAPEELYYRLSTRFDHYLFDEFQDTSVLQWDNLKVLPEDAVSKGGSLFYVGDKKQAIFSFRGGDTILFDAIRQQYLDPGYHLFTQTLSESRRSHQSIVNFNNIVFGRANLDYLISLVPARPVDRIELERVYGHAGQVPLKLSPPGYVQVEYLAGQNQEESREDSLNRTVTLLQTLRERFAWRDVGILVRKNSDVTRMTRALLQAGIPAASERTLNIKEHPHVIEVVAFLRFLDAPVDNESFAAVLLGDLFLKVSNLSLSDIQDFIVHWRQHKKEPYLYKAFQSAFPDIWDTLVSDFFKKVGLYPVYELIISFVGRWGILDLYPESRGFLMHFLELVRAKEVDYPLLGGFLRFYDENQGEEFYVPVAGSEAVRVATIHKSKGLEYRVVILPYFTFGLDRGGVRGSHAPKYVLRNVDEGLALYHFNETHRQYSSLADEEFVQEKMLMFFNELNTAYVALTRAVCEMYVYIPAKSGSSANLALQLIPQDMLTVGKPSLDYPRDKAKDSVSAVEVAPPECRDWLAFLSDEFIDVDNQQEERLLGVALHAVLAEIDYILPGGLDAKIELLLDNVLPEMKEKVKGLLQAFLSSADIEPLFAPTEAKVFTEYEMVDRYGRSKRLDRLIVTEKMVTVVDFKTSRPADEALVRRQVREYKSILSEIYPGRSVRGVLAFITEREVQDV